LEASKKALKSLQLLQLKLFPLESFSFSHLPSAHLKKLEITSKVSIKMCFQLLMMRVDSRFSHHIRNRFLPTHPQIKMFTEAPF
jgi:hypothetical protein